MSKFFSNVFASFENISISPQDIVEKQVVIDEENRTLAERLIESERHAALLYKEVENMKQLTGSESEHKALEIRNNIINGLNNLGITRENTDVRLAGTMLMGTEADVAITLLVKLNSDGNGNENIVAETVSECYGQYNNLIGLLGKRSVDMLIN